MATPMRATRNSQFVELVASGVVGRVRRDWPEDFKAEMASRSMMPGVNASALAREIGISPSQLFGWRRFCRERGLVSEGNPDSGSHRPLRDEIGSIEIEVSGLVVRCKGPIDEQSLSLVIRAVRAA
ncbi:transposase [Asticcacaulis sp. MM231]|jgi:transposase|uniref:transposase n=1 Tax=Asticcacaulis sp. MM231 TaxID=3157666 RepID=UPI0032D5A934